MRLFLLLCGYVLALHHPAPLNFLQARNDDDDDDEDGNNEADGAPRMAKSGMARQLDQVSDSLSKGDASGLEQLLNALASSPRHENPSVHRDANGHLYEDFTHPHEHLHSTVTRKDAKARAVPHEHDVPKTSTKIDGVFTVHRARDVPRTAASNSHGDDPTAKAEKKMQSMHEQFQSRLANIAAMLPNDSDGPMHRLLTAVRNKDEKAINAIMKARGVQVSPTAPIDPPAAAPIDPVTKPDSAAPAGPHIPPPSLAPASTEVPPPQASAVPCSPLAPGTPRASVPSAAPGASVTQAGQTALPSPAVQKARAPPKAATLPAPPSLPHALASPGPPHAPTGPTAPHPAGDAPPKIAAPPMAEAPPITLNATAARKGAPKPAPTKATSRPGPTHVPPTASQKAGGRAQTPVPAVNPAVPAEINAAIADVNRLKAELEAMAQKYVKYAASKAQFAALQSAKEKEDAELLTLQEAKKKEDDELTTLQVATQKQNSVVAALQAVVSQKNKDVQAQQTRIEAQKKQIMDLDAQVASDRAKYQKQVEATQKLMASWTQEAAVLKEKLKNATASAGHARTLDAELKVTKRQLGATRDKLHRAMYAIRKLHFLRHISQRNHRMVARGHTVKIPLSTRHSEKEVTNLTPTRTGKKNVASQEVSSAGMKTAQQLLNATPTIKTIAEQFEEPVQIPVGDELDDE